MRIAAAVVVVVVIVAMAAWAMSLSETESAVLTGVVVAMLAAIPVSIFAFLAGWAVGERRAQQDAAERPVAPTQIYAPGATIALHGAGRPELPARGDVINVTPRERWN